MNREIKFRAWNLRTKSFVNDEYLLTDSVNGIMKIAGVTYQKDPDSMDDEVEISQFTGLTDKNGVEIYEGDIVKEGESTAFVKYLGCSFMIEWVGMDCNSDLLGWENYKHGKLSDGKEFEVIGNIYQNHELLNP